MKKLPLLLALLMIISAFPGCTADTLQGENQKIFRWISDGEDNCINPHDAGAWVNYEIVDLIMVSLYVFAPAETRDRAVLIPALAQEEPRTEDGYTWTIKVNPRAVWQNGESINAETFIYSWQKALDPKLSYSTASALASGYIEIENALAYYKQGGTDKDGNPFPTVDWGQVGLKAADDHTLLVTCTQKYTVQEVMRHFAARISAPVYKPLYEESLNPEGTSCAYGTTLDLFMGCGPFNLTRWVKASERIFEKNQNYINAHLVKLDGISCRVVLDENARLELYESGQSDYISLGANGIAKHGDSPSALSYDQKTIRTIEVNRNNPQKPILTDPAFRKALYYAIDRQTVAKITHTIPAQYFISTWATSFADGTIYRQKEEANAWLPQNYGYDSAAAKEFFDEALQKWGLDSIELTLHYSENIGSLRAASEYIASQFQEIFGKDRISIKLQAITHTAALDLMRTSNNGPTDGWDLCWSGWGLAAETYEPHKKFAPYQSTAANRYTPYNNDYLDANYGKLLTEEYRFDEQKTFEETVRIEQSIILDDVTCIPVFQEKNTVLFSPRMIHCVDSFVPSLGFGWEYMDIGG